MFGKRGVCMAFEKIKKFLLRKAAGKAMKLLKKGPYCSAIVVAAGSATRMEGTDKIFADLAGKPVLAHSLRALEDSACINEIVIVTRDDKIVEAAGICTQEGITKVTNIVCGGEDRVHSVMNGLDAVSSKTTHVAIHDGARPMVTPSLVERVYKACSLSGAAIPGISVSDTIKVYKDGFVESTPPRESLCAVQTPQVFDADMVRAALWRASEEDWAITDDASACEKCGIRVAVCEGDRENFKITTPVDLAMAQMIMEQRDRI